MLYEVITKLAVARFLAAKFRSVEWLAAAAVEQPELSHLGDRQRIRLIAVP